MKDFVRKHRILSAFGGLGLVLAIAVLSMAVYLGSAAGKLPWQEDPTRIPITPFADIPGFSLPTKAAGVATQTPTGTPTP
jgi:predicted metal-binding protein